ncbi:MAG: trigger factor [Prevotellaceae bacterium]|nr:trigger factor [Prevotellaceae bacterium]
MNIKFDKTGNVTAELTATVEKADYAEGVKTELKQLRKKMSMPGFRPGQVPIALVKRFYETEVVAEQVNKLLREELTKYIQENKLHVLGEPLPSQTKLVADNWQEQESVDFVFDVALSPEFDATLSEKDSLDYYKISVTDEMVDDYVQMYAGRAGEYKQVDDYQPKDMVKGKLTELEADGTEKAEGLVVEGAVMLPDYIKNEGEKAKFEGAHKGDTLVMNPSVAYDGNEVELASLLKIKKEEVAGKNGDFRFEIEEITRFEAAAVDQKLFDQVYGEGTVKSEEEFRAKIREAQEEQFKIDSDFKFSLDLHEYLIARAGELELPDDMIKRLLLLNSEDKDEERINKNYGQSRKALLWQLIKAQLTVQFDVKVEDADVREMAKREAKMQLAQYGMGNVSDEVLTNYSQSMLNKREQIEAMAERAADSKIVEAAKKVVTLNEKTVTMDEFHKMLPGNEE